MAEPAKLMWKPPSGRETQMDKLRKKINLKYGLDLGELSSTRYLRRTCASSHPCV